MSNESKIFDKIRIKSRRAEAQRKQENLCEWEGCEKPGTHRAPKSQKGNGEFFNYCLAHVRQYNQSFNYFTEKEKEEEVEAAMQRAAKTGERATWGMGTNPAGKSKPAPRKKGPRDFTGRQFNDPHHLFARLAARQHGVDPKKKREKRLSASDIKALEVLGLTGKTPTGEIKAAYKALVKMHHPDANGGDRGTEDRLQAVITAYNHLKQKGLV